ncbi:MAG TPA: glycosyltransferase family 39 protein [Chitinophagaceae bacterium]|nr:glycosyltransferase family 39 protein [Chitinophagaceae bacterium]
MNGSFLHHHRLLFYSCWLLLSVIQAGFTELQDDEAYYWVYGQYLDWGYFDHPPMIGLLVKMGSAIFPNELGVRLYPLLLNLLSLLIIENLTRHKHPFLFYAIALSIAVLQLSGFIAVPDIPLIFFTALFFLCYKRFLDRSTLVTALLLGLSIALLFYSKYHAVLVVFFTVLSNLKLLARYQTWLAGLVALALFAPHLWWQYQHDWVSFRYHLFESNVNAYKFSFTADYLIGQVLLPGPLAGLILLPAAFLYKPADNTERALRFTMIGIYAFFLLSSFRGRVEANWTSPALVPLIILAHQYLIEKIKWQKLLVRLLPVTLALVVAARILMIADLVPVKALRERYHSWKEWPSEMKKRTQGLPVVISNSYQRASKYWFYTGQPAYSQNWYRERKNNYNFWPVEDSLLGKPVYFMDKYRVYRFPDSLQTPIGWMGYRYDSSFASFAKINIKPSSAKISIDAGEPLEIQASVSIPEHYRQFISNHQMEDSIKIGVFDKKGWLKDLDTPLHLRELVNKKEFTISLDPGLSKGKYFLRFTIQVNYYNATHNSDKIELMVK